MGGCGSWSQASHAELVEGLAPRFLLHRLSAALLDDFDVILTESNDCIAVSRLSQQAWTCHELWLAAVAAHLHNDRLS